MASRTVIRPPRPADQLGRRPIATSGAPGPTPRDPDTVYAPKPWASNEERLVDDALATWTLPAQMLRDIRPLYPQKLFRPRFGYENRALGIDDIARVDELYQRVDFSGRRSGYQGTSFPALGIF
ncbi:hypothetical protein [Actinomadura atramentaria]|uniref:hypothetical protein n=1 Tax=Actinomadura atramentaria TaxID=1990 RepID=UPI00037528E0|nr:hypothetical protein [Actinomadura atramentaria]